MTRLNSPVSVDKMTDHLLRRKNGPDLSFRGCIISAISSYRQGKVRWTEMRLYQTEGGSLIVESVGVTKVPGEETLHDATVAENIDAIRRFVGPGYLGQGLLKRAGLNSGIERIA